MRRLLAAAVVLAAGACAKPAAEPAAVPPPAAVAPMDLGGQRVLILPVQSSAGIPVNREDATAELVAALRARDTRTQWIDPARLRRSLAASPTFAPDPAALPNDPYRVHGERRLAGPLADVLRRYMALTEARLVLVPRSAVARPLEDGTVAVRMDAVVVDARTGMLVWWGEAEGSPGAPGSAGLVPAAAEALALRMVVPDSR